MEDRRRLHGHDASALNEASCTYGYFLQVWGQSRPKIQVKPHGTFMKCGVCTDLKEKLHGQAGCRGIQDSVLRKQGQEEYDAHVKVCRPLTYDRIVSSLSLLCTTYSLRWYYS